MKILIVDDEEMIRDVLREYVEFEGNEAFEAADGMEAVKLCRENDYDLVLMDVMMPHLDGFSAVKEIKKTKDVPVIMLSARGEEYDKIHGFELGSDDYVVKPFSPGELVARVRSHIAAYERIANGTSRGNARTAESESAEIVFGNLKLVQKSRRVFVSEKEIILAKKEFDMLLLFMQNPDRVFSKEELYERALERRIQRRHRDCCCSHKPPARKTFRLHKQNRNRLGRGI